MHEHILVDYSKNFGVPHQDTKRYQIGGMTLEEQKALWSAPLSLANLGHVQHYFNQVRMTNVQLVRCPGSSFYIVGNFIN